MERLSILIPTFNRADSLTLTLKAIAATDRAGLDVTVVVADNNSTDATHDVAASFADRLQVCYLFEPKAGKNNALNRALAEAPLGDIVVFTDDDVTPERDWLQAIARASRRWTDASIFGGRIELTWPVDPPPAWALDPFSQAWGFAKVDHGPEESEWPAGHLPFGPNYWLRASVFEEGHRFAANLGPSADRRTRTMGDETVLLHGLLARGHMIRYVPDAVVHHRLQPSLVTARGIRQRAVYYGRATAHLIGMSRTGLLARSPLAWRTLRVVSAVRYAVLDRLWRLHPSPTRRVLGSLSAISAYHANLEMLRMAREAERAPARRLSEPGAIGELPPSRP
jgi:glycosyltransferase involved in cell wall biosynthesis